MLIRLAAVAMILLVGKLRRQSAALTIAPTPPPSSVHSTIMATSKIMRTKRKEKNRNEMRIECDVM